METLETTECPDCSGPPPEFRLPPPPRPPFLTEGTFCSEAPLAELEDCVAIPMIDASYHSNPSLQSTALIITCTVVLLLMAAVVSVVFWKHKRKVQNLLPCKSAAAAAARGRLPDGGGHPGTGHLGSAVLYEDLPDTVPHSQLHNHHHHHHHLPSQPTIEVRATNLDHRQQQQHLQPPQLPLLPPRLPPRAPAPHHLDYLDYRDPRSILRVADKPSRAVLGGYRTPRALLAKSQGVPMSIASQSSTLPSSSLDNNLLLTSQNALITSDPSALTTLLTSPNIYLNVQEEPVRSTENPITPTHRPRLQSPTPASPVHRLRRPSVDSEGYSFIDFRQSDNADSRRHPIRANRALQRLVSTSRSNSIDSEGYSIIGVGNRRGPGAARRIATTTTSDGTDEEVCPLCTMQQIHDLLSKPEDIYLDIRDT